MTPADPLEAVYHPDPYPYYASLRAAGAVHRVPGQDLWAVVTADAVDSALALASARVRPPAQPVPDFLRGTRAADVFSALARMTDGQAHHAHRERTLALLRRLDAATVIAAAERVMDEHDGESGSGAVLDALTMSMPVLSVLAALGFASPVRAAMLPLVADWVAGLSPLATPVQQQRAATSMASLLELLAACGVEPDDASGHVALMMQPLDATAGLIGAGLLRLLAEPRLREAAQTGTLDWPRFAQEVLRHDAPIQNTRRTLAASLRIDGHTLAEGATLLLVLGSAAHDLPAGEAPEAFRLHRPHGRSALSLGAGPHRCPGGDAATAIATVAWRRLLPGLDRAMLPEWEHRMRWRRSANARIPLFEGALA